MTNTSHAAWQNIDGIWFRHASCVIFFLYWTGLGTAAGDLDK